MGDAPQTTRAVRFGAFERDLAAGELRKKGLKIRLQEQPFQLLAGLVAGRGDVVTREELKDKLRPSHTYGDFDRSLNTAASKLRDAWAIRLPTLVLWPTLPERPPKRIIALAVAGLQR